VTFIVDPRVSAENPTRSGYAPVLLHVNPVKSIKPPVPLSDTERNETGAFRYTYPTPPTALNAMSGPVIVAAEAAPINIETRRNAARGAKVRIITSPQT
jgi:hypothetical protein